MLIGVHLIADVFDFIHGLTTPVVFLAVQRGCFEQVSRADDWDFGRFRFKVGVGLSVLNVVDDIFERQVILALCLLYHSEFSCPEDQRVSMLIT